jgi:hypothetical protein
MVSTRIFPSRIISWISLDSVVAVAALLDRLVHVPFSDTIPCFIFDRERVWLRRRLPNLVETGLTVSLAAGQPGAMLHHPGKPSWLNGSNPSPRQIEEMNEVYLHNLSGCAAL